MPPLKRVDQQLAAIQFIKTQGITSGGADLTGYINKKVYSNQKQLEEISTQLDIQQFESVDQIVAGEINAIDSDNFNKKTLMDIYNEL